MAELYTNEAVTTLGASLTSGGTSATVASSTGFPSVTTSSGDWFMARLEKAVDDGTKEWVKVTNVSGTTWTITRGQEGSTGVAWASGDKIRHIVTAGSLTNLLQKSYTWTGDLPSIGYLLELHANFTAGTSSPEAMVFSSSTSGTKRRVWWWNENLVPRCAASRADEVPWKVHGYDGGSQTADLTQWQSKWTSGTLLSGVHADGSFYGPNIGDTFVFGLSGTLSTGTGKGHWPNRSTRTLTVIAVDLQVTDTGPSGADFVVDLNKNGTTMYTTQANRPKVTDGTTAPAYVSATLPDVVDIASGDYLSVDIDSVGSSVAGSSFTLIVRTKFKA